jgi:hypothetical protein
MGVLATAEIKRNFITQKNDSVELRTEVLGNLLGLSTKSQEKQNDYALSIPDYQRIYSWEEKHVLRLLKDIQNHAGKTYHMGSIILHQTKNKENKTVYDIVDGQQRLVTLSLLLFNLGETNFELLQESFQSKKARSYVAYNKWLIDNYIKKGNELNKDRILDNLRFSVLILKSNNLDLAYTFFSNENGKGKALSDYDLLKSHHLRYILIDKQAEHAAERWHNLLLASDNDDTSKSLGRTFEVYLFRLRKWMRKRNWNENSNRKVKTEFEAAAIIPNIAPFGEQFHFYESIQGGTHFFAYAEHFVHQFKDFSKTESFKVLNKHLNWEKHWWYRDVIEAFVFGYYLKFGNLYLKEATILVMRLVSQHRYTTSRAYLKSVHNYAASSEIVLMLDQATSPTFFLAEINTLIHKLPFVPELRGTRERYKNAILRIEEELTKDSHYFNLLNEL